MQTKEEAKTILEEMGVDIYEDNAIQKLTPYIAWEICEKPEDNLVTLDGVFTPEQLEAIFTWVSP